MIDKPKVEDVVWAKWKARRKVRHLLRLSGIESKESWRPLSSMFIVKATLREWDKINNWTEWFE